MARLSTSASRNGTIVVRGEPVARYRARSGLSRAAAASALGISVHLLSKLEQGTVAVRLSREQLERLSETIGVPVRRLLVEKPRGKAPDRSDLPLPDVFGYTDPVRFIRDTYLAVRKVDRRFTHASLGRMMGHKAAGGLAHIFGGKAALSPQAAAALAAAFGLNEDESRYLRLLATVSSARRTAAKSGGVTVEVSLGGTRRKPTASLTIKSRRALRQG